MQRAHRPHDLGPRIELRGQWWSVDLRPWGGSRYTALRNPKDAGWPERGSRTDSQDIADRWKWSYVDRIGDDRRREQLGRRQRGRPLEGAIEAYLTERETQRIAYCTLRSDATALRTHLLGKFGANANVETMEVGPLQEMFNVLSREGYRPGSLRLYATTIAAFFTWSGRKGDDNPGKLLTLPPTEEPEARPFSDDELTVLREAADRIDAGTYTRRKPPCSLRLAIELGLGTGGRLAELFAIEWSAIRQHAYTVRFTVQLARDNTGRGDGLKILKGKESRTTLILPSWWDHHRTNKRGRVLGNEQERPTRLLDSAGRWLQEVYDLAGLSADGLGWHALRHTYSRLFVEAGGRLEELQRSLGHVSIRTTEEYYGHFSDDAASTLARARIYGGPIGGPATGPQRVADVG